MGLTLNWSLGLKFNFGMLGKESYSLKRYFMKHSPRVKMRSNPKPKTLEINSHQSAVTSRDGR
jgi:hypothetical protein